MIFWRSLSISVSAPVTEPVRLYLSSHRYDGRLVDAALALSQWMLVQ